MIKPKSVIGTKEACLGKIAKIEREGARQVRLWCEVPFEITAVIRENA